MSASQPAFHVIDLDLYTNLCETLEVIAGALWGHRQLGATDGDGGHPQSVLSLEDYAEKARLTPPMIRQLGECVAGITDFWLTLEKNEVSFPPPEGDVTVYRVHRAPTLGSTPLTQTLRWLLRHDIRNPVIWNDYP